MSPPRWLIPEGVDPAAAPLVIARALRPFGDGYVAVLLPAYLLALDANAPAGKTMNEYLGLPDHVLELELPPPDLSVYGATRNAAEEGDGHVNH